MIQVKICGECKIGKVYGETQKSGIAKNRVCDFRMWISCLVLWPILVERLYGVMKLMFCKDGSINLYPTKGSRNSSQNHTSGHADRHTHKLFQGNTRIACVLK
jgi:hypothetical protein